jgi:transcriptional regulator with XRE-family HTH domain
MEVNRLSSAREALARNVRLRRVSRGLSQNRLADEAGLTQGQVSAIERGKANPTMESLGRIAQVLGVEVDVLFMKPGSM